MMSAKNGQALAARLDADPVLEALGRYWRGLPATDAVPSRKSLDPIDIPRAILPYVVLAEVGRDGMSARYRLVGTKMVSTFGFDFTGRYTHEIMRGSYLEFINTLFQTLYRERRPVYSESNFRWDADRSLFTRRLFLPLTGGGDVVSFALIGQTFDYGREAPSEPLLGVLRSADLKRGDDVLVNPRLEAQNA